MQEEEEENHLQKVRILLKDKNFEDAEQILKKQQKDNTTMASLIYIYKQMQFADEDEYQKMLYLISICLEANIDHHIYKDTTTLIINQIIGLSSLKYSIVILRSFLWKIQENKFAKFIILSHLYLYAPLLFDPTLEDISNLFNDFRIISSQVIKEEEIVENLNYQQFKDIALNTYTQFLTSMLSFEYKKIVDDRIDRVLDLVSRIIKEIQKAHKNSQQIIENYTIDYLSLSILSKFNVTIDKQTLPLTFSVAIYNQFCNRNHEKRICELFIKTLCHELSASLNTPPDMSSQSTQQILTFISFITKFLKRKDISRFICQNFNAVQALIEKINIFMGCINPEDPAYKFITKQFLPLTFLMPETRQKMISKMINKHENTNFKSHLISQYRKLVTFKTSKAIWLRCSYVLLKQLRELEPNSSIDLIGHILSFSYYWKAVSSKFIAQESFKASLHVNFDDMLQQFNQKLSNLKKGLETRPQLPQTTDQQKNEISVCLFRIDELLHPTLPYETNNS